MISTCVSINVGNARWQCGASSNRRVLQKKRLDQEVVQTKRDSIKPYLRDYEMEELLVVIVDTSRWSSQTRNQIEILQHINVNPLRKMNWFVSEGR